MLSSPLLHPQSLVVLLTALALGGLILACGWTLFGRTTAHLPKLARLALVSSAGMLFVTSVTATVMFRRISYMSVIGMVEIAFAVWLWWKAKSEKRDVPVEKWTLAEVVTLFAIAGSFSFVFHIPYQLVGGEGKMTAGEADMGFLAQSVLGLPEAGVANLWAATLGPEAAQVTNGRDFYYHWGPILLAVAARAITGLPAMTALADVSCHVMNVLLVIAAGALAGGLVRGPLWKQLLIGGIAVFGGCMLKTPAFTHWINGLLPWKDVHQAKFTLASLFPYKFEAIIAITAAAAWLRKEHRLAALFLFFGAVSAPHAVASIGVTSAALTGVGLFMRKRQMWRTGFAMMTLILAGWAVATIVFRATMGGGSGGLIKFDPSELASILKLGFLDSLLALALSALLLPGVIHLIRARDEEATEETKLLGWLVPCGVFGSAYAYHFMHSVGDAFHVMVFVHAVILAPIAILGIARMVSRHEKGTMLRIVGIAILGASSAMGLHALVVAHASHSVAEWKASDLEKARSVLKGETFGYYTSADRGWWISKHGVLASLLGSRCVRLNILKSEREASTSNFYGYTKPLRLVPPAEKDTGLSWSLRFARKVGVRYLVETTDDPLPKSLLPRTRLLLCVSGIRIYELDETGDSVAAK